MSDTDNGLSDKKDLVHNFYKLSPDVRNQILIALHTFAKLPTCTDKAMISRALTNLSQPVNIGETVVVAQPSLTETTPAPQQDALKYAQLQNDIEVIRRAINIELTSTKSQDTIEALTRILEKIPTNV